MHDNVGLSSKGSLPEYLDMKYSRANNPYNMTDGRDHEENGRYSQLVKPEFETAASQPERRNNPYVQRGAYNNDAYKEHKEKLKRHFSKNQPSQHS